MINKNFIKILEEAKLNRQLFKLTFRELNLKSEVGVISEYEASPDLDNTIISIHNNPKSLPEQIIYGSEINMQLKITVELHRGINKWEQMLCSFFYIENIIMSEGRMEISFFLTGHENQPEKEIKVNNIKLPAVMEVQNNINVWIKRIVVLINPNGSCIAVRGHEESYEEYDITPTSLTLFKSCREIKEPTWKPFETNEELEPFIDCWFRRRSSRKAWYKTGNVSFSAKSPIYLDGRYHNVEELCDLWEMKVDDNWIPVGVLEE